MNRRCVWFVVFLVTVFSVAASATTEGFDNVASLPGSGWIIYNGSTPTPGTDWFQGNPGIFSSHSGAPDSYIAANYLAGDFPWLWLAAPLETLKNGDVFSFWTRSTGSGFADNLLVVLDTSGGFVGGSILLEINPSLDPFGYPSEWTQYFVTVSGLGGPTLGRLEFVYYVPDTFNYGDYVGIDDYAYTPVPEPMTMSMMAIGLGVAAIRRKLQKA